MSQQLCHSSRAGTVVGTTGQLDLRKETAAKTSSILGCRSRNSQEISALIRPHTDTASSFGTRNMYKKHTDKLEQVQWRSTGGLA